MNLLAFGVIVAICIYALFSEFFKFQLEDLVFGAFLIYGVFDEETRLFTYSLITPFVTDPMYLQVVFLLVTLICCHVICWPIVILKDFLDHKKNVQGVVPILIFVITLILTNSFFLKTDLIALIFIGGMLVLATLRIKQPKNNQ